MEFYRVDCNSSMSPFETFRSFLKLSVCHELRNTKLLRISGFKFMIIINKEMRLLLCNYYISYALPHGVNTHLHLHFFHFIIWIQKKMRKEIKTISVYNLNELSFLNTFLISIDFASYYKSIFFNRVISTWRVFNFKEMIETSCTVYVCMYNNINNIS